MTSKLEERMKVVESTLMEHLRQSTGITTSIASLEKAYDRLVVAGLSFNIMLAVSIISYVFLHH